MKKSLCLISVDFANRYAVTLTQFLRFGMVGLSNTLIAYALNIAALTVLRKYELSWDYIAANTISFFLSVAWSFFWNNRLVFKSSKEDSIWKKLVKTYLSYALTGIVLSNILSWLWIEKLNISKYIAPLLNLILTVPVNFALNKFWAFKTD